MNIEQGLSIQSAALKMSISLLFKGMLRNIDQI